MYPTIVTPFLEDGRVDEEALAGLIRLFAQNGCDGVFAVCQSSEMFFLSEDEKVALARRSLALCREAGIRCVISGHTQDALPAQIEYLKRIEALRPDAIILVSNRLAAKDEGDEIAIKNLKEILGALKPDTPLGVYECPYPYKRPLTPVLLAAMARDGRFRFAKDTCCEIETMRARIAQLEGSGMRLFNANAATLLESMDAGAAGFSGVLLNHIPEFFALYKDAYRAGNRARVEAAQAYLSFASVIECQNYPANAKYCLMKRGIFKNALVRNGKPPLTESQTKELDAFLRVNRKALFSLLPRAPYALLFGYNEAFPECHASSVLPLAGGRVLAAYFAGAHEKADDVGIWLSVCENGAWAAPRRVFKVNPTAHWNPVLYETEEGVRIVFKVGRAIPGWQSYTALSTDGGESWTQPEPLRADNPAGGPVRNAPIAISAGAMLAPNSDEGESGWFPRVDASADGGRTWKRFARIPINREDAAAPDYMPGAGAIQPALWTDAPGRAHAFLRTQAGKIYRSDSEDGGKSWTSARPTPLLHNNSGISVACANGEVYLAMNPARDARTPLVILRSSDGGESFRCLCVLADDLLDDAHARKAEFSYPSLAARDGFLYVTFTHNRKSIAFARIRL